jgi:hypothetical protein
MRVDGAATWLSHVTRAAADEGYAEHHGFFGSEAAVLAGTTVEPVGVAVSAGAVICPSICNDFIRNYRREVVLARAMAGRGVAVQRFHYRGTGNSSGDEADTSFDTMVEDACTAAETLAGSLEAAARWFVGTRFGAIVAAAAARRLQAPCLLLVDPASDGKSFFREGFRAGRVRDLKERAADPVTTTKLLEELSRTGVVDVLGHRVDRVLYESSADRSAAAEIGSHLERVVVVQRGASLHQSSEAVVAAARDAGADVVALHVGDEHTKWWFLDEEEVPSAELVEAVLDEVAPEVAR